MDTSKHTLSTLFEQLGLASDAKSIEDFVARYSPLPSEVAIQDAPIWSESQWATRLEFGSRTGVCVRRHNWGHDHSQTRDSDEEAQR